MNAPAGTTPPDPVELSVIAPAHNEQDNIDGLIDDIAAAIEPTGIAFELIVIDDGSTDGTRARLRTQMKTRSWLRVFAMTQTPPGRGNGQSAAFHAGIRRSRGELIALIDADRQNDPADLPAMIALLRNQKADMVQGDRSANRRDTTWRRFSSWVGRTFRRHLLGDTIRDTGCSLRVFTRELGLQLPLQYKGMHRFIPFYGRLLGYRVLECAVKHRPRTAGEAKYGAWNRALPGLRDLFAVRWMRTRLRPVSAEPVEREGE
jgi:dolichol-phosphate mannosyltransferase